jgi:hypothetical protein
MFGLLVWVFVSVGIQVFRHMTGKEQLAVIKVVSYGLFTAVISVVLIAGMVVVF